MRKIYVFILFLLLAGQSFVFADNKQKIGADGDKVWDALIKEYNAKGLFSELKDTKEIVMGIDNYEGKLMQFPKINFSDFITDKNYQKYYYYGEKNSANFYVIKYNDDITKKMQKLVSVFGAEKGEYEVLGVVKEAFTWWGNVVLMDIRAIRKKGVFCITIENDKVALVGEELVDKELNAKSQDSDRSIPKNLKSVPKGLDPLTVAKLFYYVSSVEKNEEVWLKLLGSGNLNGGKPTSTAKNYWNLLVNKNRTYYYVREDSGSATENSRKYFFQRQQEGKNLGSPVPINIILENGEWRVKNASQ